MKNMGVVMLAAVTIFALACGYSSKATTPSTPGTVPAISQLAPDSMDHGGAGFILTVNGNNFLSTSVLNFNGTAQTTTFVSANQLMATIPASAIETSGTVPVTVTNPATTGMGAYGSGGTTAETSTPMNFTIN
ncbi:MAG: IPT/TIG domain-containing protein [Candidatus Sulfotelmatobacter sp.]|jgi:hypothetical protein